MRNAAIICLVICLASCSTANTKEYVMIGAPVKEYSKTQQQKAATELKECQDTTLDKCKVVIEILKDGHVLRKATKDINASKTQAN